MPCVIFFTTDRFSSWLAHVYLSEADVEFRLGNLLADMVRGPERDTMSAAFLRGVACHKAIDSFTDAHPVVRRSRARIAARHRRFSGVLIDVFYDHCLATSWDEHSLVPLDTFTAAFYASIRHSRIELPDPARIAVERIARHDLLGQYRAVEGVANSLRRLSMRLSARWQREFALEASVTELIEHGDAFANDFAEFFPALRAHVAGRF